MKNLFGLILIAFFTACQNQEVTQNLNSPSHAFGPQTEAFSKLPHLTSNGQSLFLSWITMKDQLASFQYARFDGQQWTKPELIASDSTWFVNWADYPMIAANDEGDLLAHYLVKSSPATFSYDVTIQHKPYTATNWSVPNVVHKDGTLTEHGFVTLLPGEQNQFQLAWLDGRYTSNEGHEHKGAMTLRTASISREGRLSPSVELDHKTCDCCQTAGYLTDQGPVIVYRDRSDEEIRDIYIVRKVGDTWTAPAPIHPDGWKIAGCPVNGPRIDGINNLLAVAWFTAAEGKPSVKVAFSKDAGASFESPIIIDSLQPLGRVDVVMLEKDLAAVSWLSREEKKTLIKVKLVSRNGEVLKTVRVAETDPARQSGFPQMTKFKGNLYFAWTANEADHSIVKMKQLSLNAIQQAGL